MKYLIDFIVPHHNDERVLRAIDSIRNHSSSNRFRIILMDTGYNVELSVKIKQSLRSIDIYVCGSDRGIFDAINKGVALASAEWVGWLGADDLLYRGFNIGFLDREASRNVISYGTVFFSPATRKISRVFFAPASRLLRISGAHVPHFSTFIKSNVAKKFSFSVEYKNFSDQLYFLNIESHESVYVTDQVSTLMSTGGLSNKSVMGVINTNLKLYFALHKQIGLFRSSLFVAVKLLFKMYQKAIPLATIDMVRINNQLSE
jgi:glycosyltransferase involved in cell wall biosynthesis